MQIDFSDWKNIVSNLYYQITQSIQSNLHASAATNGKFGRSLW